MKQLTMVCKRLLPARQLGLSKPKLGAKSQPNEHSIAPGLKSLTVWATIHRINLSLCAKDPRRRKGEGRGTERHQLTEHLAGLKPSSNAKGLMQERGGYCL